MPKIKARLLRPLVLAGFAWLIAGTFSFGYLIIDGRGIFKVVVHLDDREKRAPIEGAVVALVDAGKEEVAANPDFMHLAKLFESSITNAAGDALVYYYGGFSVESGEATRQVRGQLKITKKGFPEVKVELSEALGHSLKIEDQKVPQVTLGLFPTK